MTQYDAFEQALSHALSSEEMPSEGFSERVMAQIAQTPQVKADSSRQRRKLLLGAAACLALTAIAVPVVFFGTMRAGSAAPTAADSCEEEIFANDFTLMAEPAEAESGTEAGQSDGNSSASPAEEEVRISSPAQCATARELLAELGAEGDGSRYYLTEQQAAALREAMPALELPAGGFILVLEG